MAAIVRIGPVRALVVRDPLEWFDEFDLLAREVWDGWEPVVFDSRLSPSLDMYEEKDGLVIKADLPGVKEDGLEINLEGDTLHIKAEKKEEKEKADEGTKYYACERVYGSYHRTVSLPFPVEAEKVSATFDGGVLQVRLPKAEEAKPRQIKIEAKK